MTITNDDRKEINTALAKAIAYQNCGKPADAEAWAKKLIEHLKLKHILK